MSNPPRTITPDWARTATISLLTWMGVLVGAATTFRQIDETEFPVDMIIYREGVRAFMSGGEMYSEPMFAGDLALPFIYPPFGALVMVPLTAFDWMSDVVAAGIMIGLSNLLILVCLWFVLRAVMTGIKPQVVGMATAVVWAGMLLIEPVELNNGFAQLNIVLMALVVLDLVPANRPKWLPQGILVGIAAAIKLTPLVFGLYWLLRRDWRSILVAGASAITCTLLAAIWRFDSTMEFFFSTLAGMGTSSEFGVNTTYQSNSSLKGMLMRFAPDGAWLDAHGTIINIAWLMLALATIALGAWLMLRLLHRDLFVDAIMVNAVVMLLISPVSWSHHWIWLALIIPVFAWRASTIYRAPGVLGAILVLWTALILTNPPKWWFGDSIDIWSLNLLQTILVSDFVWLGIALLLAIGFGVKGTDQPVGDDEQELLADGRIVQRTAPAQ